MAHQGAYHKGMSKPLIWATLVAGMIAAGNLALSMRPSYTVVEGRCSDTPPGRQDLLEGQALPTALEVPPGCRVLVTLPNCGGCASGSRLLNAAATFFGAENVFVFHTTNPPQELRRHRWLGTAQVSAEPEFRPMIVLIDDGRVETILRSEGDVKAYVEKN